jgi:MoaA/NifB/PqqE/SkfB family radical SAM enzyme
VTNLQTLKHPKILAVVPSLKEELNPQTIESIKTQTTPITDILLLQKRIDNPDLSERISALLNDGLADINLEKYDYILRVDGDTTIPQDFVELNLKGKPDLVGWGFAQLIKTKPFLKYMNGKFYKHHDDSYLHYKFKMHNLKVLEYATQPKASRPSGKHHGYKYFIYKGYHQYRFGWEPLHTLENVMREPYKVFYTLGYFLALLKRESLYPTAQYTRRYQFRGLFKWNHIKNLLKRLRFSKKPRWIYGPMSLQLDTTHKCNLNCVYCNKDYLIEQNDGTLDLKVAEQVMREVKGFCREVRPFQNGEPLLDEQLPQFLALAKKILKARTTIYTNGTIYANRHVLIDKNLDEVHFTISAATPSTYQKVCGKPLFEQVLKTFRWFAEHKRRNQKVCVHFVIVAENLHELESWKRLFKDYPQVISQLHSGYKQYASQRCLAHIDNLESQKLSTLKGCMAHDVPCACWHPMMIGVNGEFIQCPTSPYSVNYGKVGEVHALTAWHRRNRNMMNNPACRECNQKRREWKAIFQNYMKQ